MTTSNSKSSKFVYAIGRRKSASARVRLFSGHGDNQVNGKRAEEIFSGKVLVTKLFEPLTITDSLKNYYFTAKIIGGGVMSQLDALRLGISRALVQENDNFKIILRKHDLLTRDPRERERRKVGNSGKARRQKSSPKR